MYYEKYIKYKTKYLKLKKRIDIEPQLFGGGYPIKFKKRMDMELQLLSDNGFVLENNVPETNYIIISKNNIKYKIEFPIRYPFQKPIVNNITLDYEYTPRYNLLNIIKYYEPFYTDKIDALIYCHANKYKDTKKPHWLKEHMEQKIMEKKKIQNLDDYIIKTLDIRGEPDYIVDGFNDIVIENNNSRFEFVFLPDCAGPWYDLQNKDNIEDFIDLIIKVNTMIKLNGYLFIGKILTFDYHTIITKLREKLGQNYIVKDEVYSSLQEISIHRIA